MPQEVPAYGWDPRGASQLPVCCREGPSGGAALHWCSYDDGQRTRWRLNRTMGRVGSVGWVCSSPCVPSLPGSVGTLELRRSCGSAHTAGAPCQAADGALEGARMEENGVGWQRCTIDVGTAPATRERHTIRGPQHVGALGLGMSVETSTTADGMRSSCTRIAGHAGVATSGRMRSTHRRARRWAKEQRSEACELG